MPSYDYKCPNDGIKMILNLSINGTIKIPPCPNCGKEMVRDYSPPGVSFKGTGWGKD